MAFANLEGCPDQENQDQPQAPRELPTAKHIVYTNVTVLLTVDLCLVIKADSNQYPCYTQVCSSPTRRPVLAATVDLTPISCRVC
jgi:hypothetical protein